MYNISIKKHFLLFFTLAIIVLTGGFTVGGCKKNRESPETVPQVSFTAASDVVEPVVLGVFAPLTGDSAEYGENFRKGAELAAMQINEAGGINGAPLELIFEDSKADSREAIIIAQRFISNPNVLGVIGDFHSSTSMDAAQVYSPAGLVQISPTASHPDFTMIGEYIFRAGLTQFYEGAVLGRWAVDLGFKKIVSIFLNDDWGVVANRYFTEAAKAGGAEILAMESFVLGDKDFNAILTRLKNLNPDLIYLAVHWADATLIAVQANELGFKVDMMGSGTLATDTFIQNAGAAAEGVRANLSFFPGTPRPASMKFTEDFEKTYGHLPHSHAALTFDSVMLLAEAIKIGGRDRTKIRDALAAMKDFQGATGTFTFDSDRNPVKEGARIQVRNGKWQSADR
jgi:branched-chain amino acid transport system substrate-binding protein